jgi:hypothetical protein
MQGRMRRRLLVVLTATLLLAGTGVLAQDTPLVGAQQADAAILRVPVPKWLADKIGKLVGDWAGGSILESMGYHCPAGFPLVACYKETNYDPPRWHAGTVSTGGSAYYLNARAWPARAAPVVRTFPNGWRLVIFCQTTGEWVYGRWGWTNVWDYVGQQGDYPRFVSDGFVYTGSNGFVAGDCASTNYGNG